MNTSKFKLKIALIAPYLFLGGILLVAAAPAPALAANLYSEPAPTVFVSKATLNALTLHFSGTQYNSLTNLFTILNGNSPIGGTGGTITDITTYAPDAAAAIAGGWFSASGFGVGTCTVPYTIRSSDGQPLCTGGTGYTSYGGTFSTNGNYLTLHLTTPLAVLSTDYVWMQINWSGQTPNQPTHTLGGIGGSSGGSCVMSYYDLSTGFADTPPGPIDPKCSSYVSSLTSVFAAISGSGGFVPPAVDTSTRIDSVIPPNDFAPNWPLARATSTTFALGASGFVNASDYQAGDYVSLEVFNNAQNSSIAAVSLFSSPAFTTDRVDLNYKIPLSGSGAWLFSTSTDLEQIGVYTMQTQIHHKDGLWNSIVGFFSFIPGVGNGSASLTATTTQFLVATTTVFDAFQGNSSTPYLQAYQQATASSTCTNWGDPTQLSTCVNSLFVPNQAQSAQTYALFQSAILNRAPVGYITRLGAIISSSTAPVEPIALSYTFGSSSPAAIQGDTYTLNIFDSAYIGSTSPLASIRSDDGQNKNIWGIVDPYFTTVVAISVFLVILSDLMGIELNQNPNELTPVEQYKINRSFKKSSKEGRDERGRTGSERRTVIAERGARRDAAGGRGIIH